MKKIFFTIMALGFIFSVSYAEEVAKIVAKVNSQVITAKDLEDYYKAVSYTHLTLPTKRIV